MCLHLWQLFHFYFNCIQKQSVCAVYVITKFLMDSSVLETLQTISIFFNYFHRVAEFGSQGFELNFHFFSALFWALGTTSGSKATRHIMYLSCLWNWSPGVKCIEAKPCKAFKIAAIS